MEQPNSPSLDPRLGVPRRQPESELEPEPSETEAALSIQTAVRAAIATTMPSHHHHHHPVSSSSSCLFIIIVTIIPSSPSCCLTTISITVIAPPSPHVLLYQVRGRQARENVAIANATPAETFGCPLPQSPLSPSHSRWVAIAMAAL
jgi:hypothetical protein